MQEILLHYIWKNSLFGRIEYLADSGEEIQIIQTGIYNTNAGPDFTNAKIRIRNTIWAGNVEIHKRSSDWYHHRHHEDAAYNNVILHVVLTNDKTCLNQAGRAIPTVCITPEPELVTKYQQLMLSEKTISCNDYLPGIEPDRINFWLQNLLIERLMDKTESLNKLLQTTCNNWEEAFYIQLCRNFGLILNALPFELLARSLPLKILRHDPENRLRTEALLFGQAGFLGDEPTDDYMHNLKKEYSYHQKKHKLKPIEKHLWKFLRSRPLNFPGIRIAQLSALLCQSSSLFSDILNFEKPNEVVDYFSCDVSEYWKNHYIFGKESAPVEKKLGRSSVCLIIINTLAPFLFIYGDAKNKEFLKERAVSWLEELPSEKNHIIRMWKAAGILPRHAGESQALIQLTTNYCKLKNCLQCQIGNKLIKP